MGNGAGIKSVKPATPDFFERYSLKQYLDKGHFGKVSVCVSKTTGDELAVKMINTEDSYDRQKAAEEKEMWSMVSSHKYIVDLHDFFCEGKMRYFVMERCEKTLHDIEKSRRFEHYEEGYLLDLMQQLLQAVGHCHHFDLAHRDIKPANCLIAYDGTLKLCDFGVSEFIPEDGLVGRAGTPYFMAPEMLNNAVYRHEVDIWSVGVTAYVLLYCEKPYTGYSSKEEEKGKDKKERAKQATKAIVENSIKPAFKPREGIVQPSLGAENFIRRLMERNPALRPSATRCMHLAAVRHCQVLHPKTNQLDAPQSVPAVLCGSRARVATAKKKRLSLVQLAAEPEEKSWHEKDSLSSRTTGVGSTIRSTNWTAAPSMQLGTSASSSQLRLPPVKPAKERTTRRTRSQVPTQR